MFRFLPTRRLIGWGLFLLALVALGFGLWHVLPPQPRATIEKSRNIATMWLSQDGSRFLTVDYESERQALDRYGTLRLWDTQTGQEVRRFLAEARFLRFELSRDWRYFVCLDDAGLRFVNLETGREWATPIKDPRV